MSKICLKYSRDIKELIETFFEIFENSSFSDFSKNVIMFNHIVIKNYI